MITLTQKDLLKAGVHLGHLSRKWNPSMAPFIFMESRGIHIIDLNKTLSQLQEAADTLQAVARSGKKILFVATKKQAKELVAQTAKSLNMPYMTERWLGGTLTNFITIRRLIKKLTSMERMMKSATYKNMAKKEQLMIARDKDKLERVLGGVLDLTKLPGALVVVDIMKESIAVQEARKLGIPIIALADTNVDPDLVDYPIPSNDDATPAIELIVRTLGEAINEGLSMRQEDKAAEAQDKDAQDTEDNKGARPRGAEKVAYSDADSEEDNAYGIAVKASKNKTAEPVERFKKSRTPVKGSRPIGVSKAGDKPKK
ncbi:ribosomal protein S2 [Candidatus Amoebophilus asiaticus 5a2]|uniref:Small ribosomal subunit protein uS2 n=1 Tax=Amoebophilus asiaticus (strain 5a2) TaxID=452471 RepID=RS2_AMOA5|nr:RecName: Full=Small ribosomal subunit protein uS2; AltName: Full=30S ribosomal protein S2 [Candidatus Amoebophilus asiaticus 5a2]ACE05503.1 ribosomal protein S2 [Candidatus Amoebophilus asiaticus 5a2]